MACGNDAERSWPTSTSGSPTDPSKPSTVAWSTSAASPWDSATSTTTSCEHSSTPARFKTASTHSKTGRAYKWRKAPASQRDWDDAHLINAARDIHADDPAFGYRFIADELPGRGITAGENRVARLCSQERIWSVFAKKRGLNRRSGPPVHDDLVQRQFSAHSPNQLWLADITEHRTDEGKLYLCAIKDVYSNRIVGYSIDSRMKSSLAVAAALDHAVALRSPVATIVHSDRGSQFRSRKFVHALSENGLHGSMGRVGACGDNAAMESFFALLQRNVLDRRRWSTRAELRLAIVTWIERTYHRRRRQRALGRLTPIEFELLHTPAATAA